MTKKKRIVFFLILAILTAGLIAWGVLPDKEASSPEATYQPKAVTESPHGEADEEIKPPDVTPTENLTIDNLRNGDSISDGSKIEGMVKSPDGTLHVAIKGATTGKISDFTVKVPASSSKAIPYSLEVYFERMPESGEKGFIDIYTTENDIRAYSKQVQVILK